MDKKLLNRFFTWDIDYKCNYHCSYCFLNFEPQTTSIKAIYLKKDKWISIWENIYKRYGSSHILVTGGEPFIYPDFINLISELSEMHTFEFSTNLFWDVDEFIQKIKPTKVRINSSFHPEFVSIEEFIRKILLLKQNNYQISITIVAYPPMLEKIFDYKKKFEEFNFNLIIYPYRGLYNNKNYPEGYTDKEKELIKVLDNSINLETNKELYDIWINREKTSEEKKVICRMGQFYAKIVPDGSAFRCCAAVNKNWGYLGNLIDGSFDLTAEPQICTQHSQNCVCFRAMILGEEDKWFKYWNPC